MELTDDSTNSSKVTKMNAQNTSKICLVTGASSGIGLATAVELLRAGYTVYGAARHVEKMRPLEAMGGRVIAMDLTSESGLVKAVNTVIEEQKRIDILVNNAGAALPGSIEDIPVSQARDLFEVNLFGSARLIQLVLPHMREQRSGTIINVSSIGGVISLPLAAWYYASKHALEAFSDTLRQEAGRFGINVVIIEPGIIKTDFEKETAKKLREVSGHGPYRNVAEALAKQTENMFISDVKRSEPIVVAKAILNVVESPVPKTRYAVGYMAKLVLAFKRLLSDRQFDHLFTSNLK